MERKKTSIAVALALAVTVLATVTRPKQADFDGSEVELLVGESLVDFDDPGIAASLEILSVDTESGELRRFKIVRNIGGSWTIPSHANYPADAEYRVRDVSTLFIGQKILDIAPSTAKKHEYFGVLEPTADNAGEDGVGILVKIEDRKGDELVALVIGKANKADPTQRFVRKLGQDLVLVTRVDPSILSTDFNDWIEKDLLQVSTLDLQNVQLRDYSVVETEEGTRLVNRSIMDIQWDPLRGKWTTGRMVTYKQGQETDGSLTPDEELNVVALNQMKKALDDLAIVDVRPKPQGLGGGFQATQAEIDELEKSLKSLGFRGGTVGSETVPRLLADNGEAVVTMRDGVRYILKFGAITAKNISELGEQNRVLMVTAELDDSKSPMPPKPTLPVAKDGDDVEAIAAQRQRIEKEYQRQLDLRNDGLSTARRRVLALNDRFGAWYYVISDDSYQQIMLGRDEVIQSRTKSGADRSSEATDKTDAVDDTDAANTTSPTDETR